MGCTAGKGGSVEIDIRIEIDLKHTEVRSVDIFVDRANKVV